jgi:serine/threonine protein kinase
MIQVLVALRDIHNTGYVHGDIKPANLMFVENEDKTILQVIDFGRVRSYLEAGQKMDHSES